ncbi:putative RNA-directed DNA polymerase [Helianthus annuus]|nr:putative RNA-directed DNA polymerase [Helianthus annuus]
MIMHRAEEAGLITGIKLPNHGPTITHLSYADDVMFLCEWSIQNAVNIHRMLRCFSLLTGLNGNLQKSKVYGVGVSDSDINEVAGIFKCEVDTFLFTYLGLPIGANMKRAKHWEPIIKRFQKRLNGWKAKTLSFAGRVTLAKSVLGSLSSYFLGIFKVPKVVLKTLEGIRRKFVWEQVGNKNKICWFRWGKMLRSKRQGGLGIRGLESFNLAMVAKWWWRIREDLNQLWARVIAAIHGSDKCNKMVPINKNIKGWWKDITDIQRSLMKMGINIKDKLKVQTRNGMKSKMWFDDWAACGPLSMMFPNVFKLASDKGALVSACYDIIGSIRQWR